MFNVTMKYHLVKKVWWILRKLKKVEKLNNVFLRKRLLVVVFSARSARGQAKLQRNTTTKFTSLHAIYESYESYESSITFLENRLFLWKACFLNYSFTTESVRWLLIHGKTDEAIKSINKIAKFNGLPKPDSSKFHEIAVMEESELKSNATKYNYATLFRMKSVRMKTILFGFCW